MQNFGNNYGAPGAGGDPFSAQGYANAQPPMSKKEYLKNHAPEFKKNIRIGAIVSYIFTAINLLLLLLLDANYLVVLDMILQIALILGIQLAKSKGCAIAITVYGAVNMILAFLSTGLFSGWGWLAVGIYFIQTFNKAEKEYKAIYNVQ